MRFCFLIPQLEHYSPVSGGAIATITENVSRELQRFGHQVEVIASECIEPVYESGAIHWVKAPREGAFCDMAAHLEARFRKWDAPHEGRFYAKSLNILEKLQPDVVILANDLRRIRALKHLLPRTRVVVWMHNECRLRKGSLHGIGAADVFLCCSGYLKNWLLREYALQATRVYTARAGVDHTLFHPAQCCPPDGELRVLFTGRLDFNKGVDIAVEVVSRLRKRGVPIRLTVAGNTWFYRQKGASNEPFQFYLRSAMREAGVDWMGHVPRRFLPEVMRQHDVALVPSRSEEPFGLVVLESMASGLAVLASPYGGLREACGNAAKLVEPENVAEIESWLEQLCADREELHRWKARSLKRVQSAHWRDTAEVLCHAVGTTALDAPCNKSAETEAFEVAN